MHSPWWSPHPPPIRTPWCPGAATPPASSAKAGRRGGYIYRPASVPSLTGVIAAAGWDANGYALRDDGTVWAWGSDSAGQLGTGATGASTSPLQVLGLSGITGIAGGERSGVAMRYDGTAWAWGA